MKPALRKEAEAALASWGLELPEQAFVRMDAYLRDVLEYNSKTNLTAAKDEDELLRRHGLDAWAAVAALKKRLPAAPAVVDVGSGGGFIGVGLKIAWPEAAVTLLEATYRKFKFLNWASARLGMPGLNPVQGRAGAEFTGAFDAAVARALAPLPEALELTLALTKPGGWAVVYQSEPCDANAEPVRAALAKAGGSFEESVAYALPGETAKRHLTIVRRHS